VIKVSNQSEYPTREVNRLARKALGYLDISDGVDVVVCHFQKKTTLGQERTWMGGWYNPRRRQIVAKIVRPGLRPHHYHPYQRKREQGRTFELRDWREQLVALVTHEGYHHKQRTRPRGNRFVEVECDLAAYRAVQYLREDEGTS
jgi:hypothetical protein